MIKATKGYDTRISSQSALRVSALCAPEIPFLSLMEKKIGTTPLDELFFITSEFLVPYLTYISEHKTLFRVVISKPEAMQANKTYDEIFCDVINPILERYGVCEKNRGYMLAFYIESGAPQISDRYLAESSHFPGKFSCNKHTL